MCHFFLYGKKMAKLILVNLVVWATLTSSLTGISHFCLTSCLCEFLQFACLYHAFQKPGPFHLWLPLSFLALLSFQTVHERIERESHEVGFYKQGLELCTSLLFYSIDQKSVTWLHLTLETRKSILAMCPGMKEQNA